MNRLVFHSRKLLAVFLLAGLMAWPDQSFCQDAAARREATADAIRALDATQVRLLPGSPFFDRQELHRHGYLASFDADRLLYHYRALAKLSQPQGAKPYESWDSGFIRGHMTGHYLSAAARMAVATGDNLFRDRVNYIVAELAKCQDALKLDGYLAAFPVGAFDRLEGKQGNSAGVVVPYYTIHKIMAGLLDAHHYLGNAQALQVAQRMAAYFEKRLAALNSAQIETIFRTDRGRNPQNEFGAMSDVLAELYEITGEKQHLEAAQLFNREWFMGPLAKGEDHLGGLHANTHIAQAVGLAHCANITGNAEELKASENFWRMVTAGHSFVIGGNSFNEWFDKPGVEVGPSVFQQKSLPPKTAESCNTHNMLKLTARLFQRNPRAEYADFAERALYDHLLATVAPDTGKVTYFTPLRGTFRTYLKGTECCVGTGIENTPRYNESIFFQRADSLWVNLYIPSELDWRQAGLVLRQEGDVTRGEPARFTIVKSDGRSATLQFRIPHWISKPAVVTLNGKVEEPAGKPSSYVALKRNWKAGDVVTLSLPAALRLERAKDDPSMVSVFFGPVLLAGELGRKDMPNDSDDSDANMKTPAVPVPDIASSSQDPADWLQPVPGAKLTFAAHRAGPADGIVFRPLYDVHHQRYSVYWRLRAAVDSAAAAVAPLPSPNETSLAGQWTAELDPKNVGESEKWAEKKLAGSIRLPGSTAEGRLGDKDERLDVNRWTPRYAYTGAAWYQRTIDVPPEWRGKRIVLFLERCMWATDVWVDGQKTGGREDSLITPHVHVLGALTPGSHSLTLRVDNSSIWELGYWSHAYSPEIQTIWNGVVGRIELQATDPVWIDRVDVYGDPVAKRARVRVVLGGGTDSKVSIDIPPLAKTEGAITRGTGEFTLDLGEKARPWDEFNPVSYRATVRIPGDEKTVTFGLRTLTTDQHHIYINGRLTYFRGTHDGGSFPLTGYPSTKVEDWRRIFTIGKSYGLNHFRFHSWSPPEAAFIAADEIGVYLQCELPLFSLFAQNPGLPWTRNAGGRIGSPRTDPFMAAELDRILRAYANHPSFCQMSMGNELKGNVSLTDAWTADARKKEPRILFTSFSNPASAGRSGPGPNDQFMVFHGPRQERRGERIFNTEFPRTDKDYDASLRNVNVPTLSHEVGQWVVFPNLREIDKYTGILRPTNLEAVRDRLAASSVRDQADEFLVASGKFSLQLYREEIERSLRSADEQGFQLLDLHDYAGQGSAWVGILDSFWDSKGIISPQDFRQFCAPNVLLARMPKRVWLDSETPEIGLEVASYGAGPLGMAEIVWSLRTDRNEIIASGKLPPQNLDRLGVLKLGTIKVPLASVKDATCCELRVEIPDTRTRVPGLVNSWKLWVYPASLPAEPADVLVTSSWEKAKAALDAGGKVLFTPTRSAGAPDGNIPISFTPPFWNGRQPANRPGNHGLLIDGKHPALAAFPTDFYADWQWWELMRNGRTAMLDDKLPQGYRPIVQPIDQPFRDAKLGAVYELANGPGKLMVCTMDIETDLEHRIVARQLRWSLLRYMSGDKFQPKTPSPDGDWGESH